MKTEVVRLRDRAEKGEELSQGAMCLVSWIFFFSFYFFGSKGRVLWEKVRKGNNNNNNNNIWKRRERGREAVFYSLTGHGDIFVERKHVLYICICM